MDFTNTFQRYQRTTITGSSYFFPLLNIPVTFGALFKHSMPVAELWALVTLGFQFIGTVQKNIELAKQIVEFLKPFSEWVMYRKHLREKVKSLKTKLDILSSREEDIVESLRIKELEPGLERTKEVETWLESVKQKKLDVQSIEQEAREKRSLFGLLLGNSIERNRQDVDELLKQSEFPHGITRHTRLVKEPFLTQKSVGHERYLETIVEWLTEPEVSIIGVYGPKGIGKTAILTHIQSRLSQSTNTTFERVFWVTLTEQTSVHKLQNSIAKQVGFNLSDDEEKMRQTRLCKAITKSGKSVIILDGVGKRFFEEVEILKEANGCKLLLSTVSKRYCNRMDCDKALEIKPLPHCEAVKLFMEKLSIRDPSGLGPEIEAIVEPIVRECRGLPLRLVGVAKRLRGVYEISEWKDELAELKNGHA